jgi:hypothetical protein
MGTTIGKKAAATPTAQATPAQEAKTPPAAETKKPPEPAAPAEPVKPPDTEQAPAATLQSRVEAKLTKAYDVTAGLVQNSVLGKLNPFARKEPETLKAGVGAAVREAAQRAVDAARETQKVEVTPVEAPPDPEAIPFTPNPEAVDAARTAHKGALDKIMQDGVKRYGATYREASEKTGVPAHIIAAIHYNEGKMTCGKGPESGFGLDPRAIKTSAGNGILAKHGLSPWERGTGSDRAVLQSAIIAAETLKASAAHNGAKVGPNMTAQDYNVAIHSYSFSKQSSVDRAKAQGRGFMFDPADPNPHPLHPGGTSVDKDGKTIPVGHGRVATNLRWDVACPLLKEQLDKQHPRPGAAPAGAPPPDAVTPPLSSPQKNAGNGGDTDTRAWSELPAAERTNWNTLGWNEGNWEKGPPPPSSAKEWKDLVTPEQEAARALGYNEAKWNAEEVKQPGPPPNVQVGGIPPRPADAMTGTQFAEKIKNLPVDKREKAILEEIEKGNIPESMRTLEPVTVRRAGQDGKVREVTTYVMRDYVCIGSDKDYLRVPLLPSTAQRIADKMGCSLPTRTMVNDIHQNATRKSAFQPLHGTDAYRASGRGLVDHDRKVDDSFSHLGGDGIASGHKKDIIIPAPKGKVALYGGFWADGNPVHDFRSHAHSDGYQDYSHGARMVSTTVYVDGRPMPMEEVLRDPNLAPLLSEGGAVERTRYPTR